MGGNKIQLFKPEHIIRALRENNGVVSLAARDLGCSLGTIQLYRDRYPEVDEEFAYIKQGRDDYVFGKLLGLIEQGEEKSVHFYLRTQVDGFSERKEVEFTKNLNVDGEVKITADELAAEFMAFKSAVKLIGEEAIDGEYEEQ